MNEVTQILATLVALEHCYIFYLETVVTTSPRTARAFGLDPRQLRRPPVRTLLKNQGVYNGLLAVLIILAAWWQADRLIIAVLMLYVIAVAVYGGITSRPKIFWLQGSLPLLALVSLWWR